MKKEEKPDLESEVPETRKESNSSTESQVSQLTEHLQRLQAEFENYQKRTLKEHEQLRQHASATLVAKLLPTLDEWEHVLTQVKDKHSHEGLSMLYKNLKALLESEGLVEMDVSAGSLLDPYRHDAVQQQDSAFAEGCIVSVLKKGYLFKERVLRHAVVIVSKGGNADGK